jgi:hypothetical protein
VKEVADYLKLKSRPFISWHVRTRFLH